MQTNEMFIGQRLASPQGVGRVLDISDDHQGVLLLLANEVSQWFEPEVLSTVDPAQPTREGLVYYAYDPQLPPRRDVRWESRRRELFHAPDLVNLLNTTFGDVESAPNRHCHVWIDTSLARIPEAADIVMQRYSELNPGSVPELVIDTGGDEAKLARVAGEILCEFVIHGYVNRRRREFILLRLTQCNGYNVQLLDVTAAERRLDLVQVMISHLQEAYQQAESELCPF